MGEDDAWAEEAKGIFAKYDANGDGWIDEDELGRLLMAISDKFTKRDIRKLLKEADTDKSGHIDFKEFIDWLTRPSIKIAMVNSSALEVLFDVYDKEGTGMISTKQFRECHVILQAALQIIDVDPEADQRNGDIKNDISIWDEELAKLFLSPKAKNDMIGFMDFVDWMKQHIPPGMDQNDFYDFAEQVASSLRDTFQHDFATEKGYVREKENVLQKVTAELAASMEGMRSRSSQIKTCPWDDPPKGLSIDRLKAKHMMAMPLNMMCVDNVSWEILCMPSTSPDTQIWLAEVVRRVLMKTGKLKVENQAYYRYNVESAEWEPSSAEENNDFYVIQPGLGLYSLLKSAANFGMKIRWREILTALEGGVDMTLITDTHLERYTEHMKELVLTQLEEDGCEKLGDSRESKMIYADRYLANELQIHPGMVMATLLKLEIVESNPAWEAYVEEA